MKSRLITSAQEIEEVINASVVCHVGMVQEDSVPYVLPFNFGYDGNRLFIHSGPQGKKIDIWKQNSRVCVAFSTDYQMRIQNESVACSYSMRYRSVLVHGNIEQIFEMNEKERILNVIMKKYAGRDNFSYSRPALENVSVFEVVPLTIEGRAYGY